jgi:hypothetical protein
MASHSDAIALPGVEYLSPGVLTQDISLVLSE